MHFIDPEHVGSGLVLLAIGVIAKAVHKFWQDLNAAFTKIRRIERHLKLEGNGHERD